MRKFVVSPIILGVLFFLGILLVPKSVFAAQCSYDTYNAPDGPVGTYCSLSCGGNQITSGYTGCGFAQFCCAETSKKCEGGCQYGRKMYCSIDGGGNSAAPSDFQDCGAGRTCYLGSVDASCPAQASPAGGPYCVIDKDQETGTDTFCAALGGQGSQVSQNSSQFCGGGRCFRVSANACGGCQYGRREVCKALDGSGFASVAKSCSNILTKCFLGDYDSSCPAPVNQIPATPYCNLTPYNYNGKDLQTYCSLSCGGNLQVGTPGCGTGQVCCVSKDPYKPLPSPGFFSQEKPSTEQYDVCAQIPDTTQRGLCQECNRNGGGSVDKPTAALWTAVGCIPTTSEGIVGSLVKLGLGIAGTAAVLMILAGGFMLSTSQGDTKRVGEAKELVTSAVIGLLFIIFSVTLLQFIGVKLFHIPGFGS